MKDIYQWSEDIKTGIDIIDRHHKRFIYLVNELHRVLRYKDNDLLFKNILTELIDFVNFHFSTEERFFKKYNYPKAFIHKIEHKKLKEEVYKFYERYKNGDIFVKIDLANFLVNWFVQHLNNYDKEFALFLKSRVKDLSTLE